MEDELVVPTLRSLPAADGSTPLQVAIFLPTAAASPPTSPPAVVWVYGGPHSQLVRDAWDLTVNPTRQALAHAGFAVVVADNRGTANRGLAFEAVLSGILGDFEVADQAAVIEALAAEGIIDRDRIGITGASYGGFMTVMAMLRRPDLFRAGVAGAPVVDWDGYDTAYTERYLGTPSVNPDAYAASSLLPRAENLDGDLLLIHGALDENVHLRHTGRLLAALQAAGRAASLVMLPNDRHSPRSPASALVIGRHTVRHLCKALAVPIPEDLLPRDPDPGDAHAAPAGQAAS
jgi:dipeptidyl-peptidase-4